MPVMGMYSQQEVAFALGLTVPHWHRHYIRGDKTHFMGIEIPKAEKLYSTNYLVYPRDEVEAFIAKVRKQKETHYTTNQLYEHLPTMAVRNLVKTNLLWDYPIEPKPWHVYRHKNWWPAVNIRIIVKEVTTGLRNPRDNYLHDHMGDDGQPIELRDLPTLADLLAQRSLQPV